MKTLLRDLRDLALWAQLPARLLEPDLARGLPASRSQLSEGAAVPALVVNCSVVPEVLDGFLYLNYY